MSGDITSTNAGRTSIGAGSSNTMIADDAVTADKLADTAVTAGSYTAADMIDAQGRITAASNGSIAMRNCWWCIYYCQDLDAIKHKNLAADAINGEQHWTM